MEKIVGEDNCIDGDYKDQKNLKKEELHFETTCVHAGLERIEDEVKEAPLYASTSFVFNDSAHGAAIFSMDDEAFCYSRIRNPTVDVFEKRMAGLEGGAAALATATGEAALFITITSLAQHGDNIIIASPVSESTMHQFKHRLPALGITAQFLTTTDQISTAINPNTKAIFIESISLSTPSVANIPSLSTLAHTHGLPLIVDNTLGGSGYFLRPISHGADLIISSCTPYISISGSNQGGVIIDSGSFPWEAHQSRFPQFFEPSPGFHGLKIWEKFGKLALVAFARIAIMRDIGPCMNPMEASLLLAGVETLGVRMEKVSGTTLELAKLVDRFEDVKYLDMVYPMWNHEWHGEYLKRGYGGVFSFLSTKDVDIDTLGSKLQIVSIGTSIGGSRTKFIAGPAERNEETARIYVSVGLEHVEDLKADFAQALGNRKK